MNVKLLEEKEREPERSLESSYLVEVKKIEIFEQLENAITKLKETRLEIRKAVEIALKMKETGNDIANQVIAAVAEVLDFNDNPWLERTRNLELWFPKLKY